MFPVSGVTAGIAAHGSDEEGIGTMGPRARSTALEAFDVPSYHTDPWTKPRRNVSHPPSMHGAPSFAKACFGS